MEDCRLLLLLLLCVTILLVKAWLPMFWACMVVLLLFELLRSSTLRVAAWRFALISVIGAAPFWLIICMDCLWLAILVIDCLSVLLTVPVVGPFATCGCCWSMGPCGVVFRIWWCWAWFLAANLLLFSMLCLFCWSSAPVWELDLNLREDWFCFYWC